MKKIKTLFFIIIIIIPLLSQAQAPKFRPDINSLTQANRLMLSNLLKQYLTPNKINEYYGISGFNSSNNLTYVKSQIAMLQDFEDWLTLNGHNQGGNSDFVPFPAWNLLNTIPTEFQGADPDCTTCGSPSAYSTMTRQYISPIRHPNDPVSPGSLCNQSLSSFCDYMTHSGTSLGGLAFIASGQLGLGQQTPDMMPIPYLMSMPFYSYYEDIMREWTCDCPGQNINPKDVDLYVKDNVFPYQTPNLDPPDIGLEPNLNTITWDSHDIWVRNDNTGFSTDQMQNPHYSLTVPVSVYVRVRNRGCSSSLGSEHLKLYWAKAGTSHSWPAPWDGVPINGQQIGGLIGDQAIPVIDDGDQKIIKFNWLIPNPNIFGGPDFDLNNDNTLDAWHFCLLARVDATNDTL